MTARDHDSLNELAHSADDDVARLSRSFFSRPPVESAHEAWDELPATPMAHGARRAMFATLAIAGVSALLLCGFLVYQRVIMPVPVELGAGASLPPADMAYREPETPPGVSAQAAMIGTQAPVAVAKAAAPVPVAVPVAAPVAVPVAPAPVAAPVPVAPAAQPSEVAPAAEAEVTAKLEAAHELDDRGRRAQAITAYEEVLALQPAHSIALSRLGYLHLQAGDDARARDYAARAVELDATSSEGWIVLGAALEALRDRAGARTAYQQCAATGTGPYAAECKRLAR